MTYGSRSTLNPLSKGIQKMIQQTGETASTKKYLTALVLGESKMGKTVWEVASALGVLPWQQRGGMVSKPQNLHVLAFDEATIDGVHDFLQMCNAPPEASKWTLWNFEDDVKKMSETVGGWNHSLFIAVKQCRDKIGEMLKGQDGVVLVSSLTSLAQGVERGLMGQPTGSGDNSGGKGYGDGGRWAMLSQQLSDLRNHFQVDAWHLIWEGHLRRVTQMPKPGQQGPSTEKDSISVKGEAGRNWGNNVAHVWRLRRTYDKFGKTKVDQVYLETKPSVDFLSAGRNSNRLEEKEIDLTVVCEKLGLRVGHWGAKTAPAKGK